MKNRKDPRRILDKIWLALTAIELVSTFKRIINDEYDD